MQSIIETLMVQDLIAKRFNVSYHPHYVSTLLRNLGFSFQRARFVAAHLNEAKRQEWMTHKWPEILRLSAAKDALILFGDEASFAQWGVVKLHLESSWRAANIAHQW
ncbi:winged helix-turn-helix domain-containing protein (plasmid) [Acaryochloris sp. 'Moss Beach']|uniref:winged helix-turn-helix domain-containing protein n=1 Tax=Acaryochloris sp. 'Moss Beach' TaxID=2740837 RepID=UPI001F3FF1C9|nr:winged helix-turn-helix domain-containing protein [Acaryochloris sp. 'Moss Beach']UJB73289.1 winged helix-turn-helix domain-containing protein [Acaryochloris sp. 'Moss Beach']